MDRIRSEFRGFALCHEVLESGSGIRAVVTVSLRNGAQKSLGGLDARRARSCESHPPRDPLRPPDVRHRAWKWTLAVVCSAAVPGDTGPCAPLPRFHVLRWTSKRPGSGEGRTARLRRSLQRSDEVSPRCRRPPLASTAREWPDSCSVSCVRIASRGPLRHSLRAHLWSLGKSSRGGGGVSGSTKGQGRDAQDDSSPAARTRTKPDLQLEAGDPPSRGGRVFGQERRAGREASCRVLGQVVFGQPATSLLSTNRKPPLYPVLYPASLSHCEWEWYRGFTKESRVPNRACLECVYVCAPHPFVSLVRNTHPFSK